MEAIVRILSDESTSAESQVESVRDGIAAGWWDVESIKSGMHLALTPKLSNDFDHPESSVAAFRKATEVLKTLVRSGAGGGSGSSRLSIGDFIEFFIAYLNCFPLKCLVAVVLIFEEQEEFFRHELLFSSNQNPVSRAKLISLVKEFERRLVGTEYGYLLARVYKGLAEAIPFWFSGIANRGGPKDNFPLHGAELKPLNSLQGKKQWDCLLLWDSREAIAQESLLTGTAETSEPEGVNAEAVVSGGAAAAAASEEGAIEASEFDSYLAYHAVTRDIQNLPAHLAASAASSESTANAIAAQVASVLELQQQHAAAATTTLVPSSRLQSDRKTSASNPLSMCLWPSAFDSDDVWLPDTLHPPAAVYAPFAHKKLSGSVSKQGRAVRRVTRPTSAAPPQTLQVPTGGSHVGRRAHSNSTRSETTTLEAGDMSEANDSQTTDSIREPDAKRRQRHSAGKDDACGGALANGVALHGSVSRDDGGRAAAQQQCADPRQVAAVDAPQSDVDLQPQLAIGEDVQELGNRRVPASLHIPWVRVPAVVGPSVFDVSAVAAFYDQIKNENFKFLFLMKLELARQSIELQQRKGEPPLLSTYPESTRRIFESIRRQCRSAQLVSMGPIGAVMTSAAANAADNTGSSAASWKLLRKPSTARSPNAAGGSSSGAGGRITLGATSTAVAGSGAITAAASLNEIAACAAASAADFCRPYTPRALPLQFNSRGSRAVGSGSTSQTQVVLLSSATAASALNNSSSTANGGGSGGSESTTPSSPTMQQQSNSPLTTLFAELLSKETLAVKWKLHDPPAMSPFATPVTSDSVTALPAAPRGASGGGVDGCRVPMSRPADRRSARPPKPLSDKYRHLKRRAAHFNDHFISYLAQWNMTYRPTSIGGGGVKRVKLNVTAADGEQQREVNSLDRVLRVDAPSFERERHEWGCRSNLDPRSYEQFSLRRKVAHKLDDYLERMKMDDDPTSGIEESERAVKNKTFIFRLNRLMATTNPELYRKHMYNPKAAAAAMAANSFRN